MNIDTNTDLSSLSYPPKNSAKASKGCRGYIPIKHFQCKSRKADTEKEQPLFSPVLPCQYWKLPELFSRKKITMSWPHATYLICKKNMEVVYKD